MATSLSYPPALLNREEAAAYLAQISTRKLDQLQAEGLVIPKALKGTRCYLRADLDKYAAGLPDWETKNKTA